MQTALGNMELRSAFFGCSDEDSTALLLAQRPELPNERDYDGCTLLHWCAHKGYDKISAQLLAQRPELANVLDYTNWSALQYAALAGHEAVVTQLLAHTTSSRIAGGNEWTELDCALQNGHDKIVGLLLDHCPELIETVTFRHSTGFYIAAYEGHDKAMAQVLARGPKFDKLARVGYNPLHAAAGQGHDKVISLFYNYNPALLDLTDSDDLTLLHEAARCGHANVVAQLLAYNPKLVDAVNLKGETPFQFALRNGDSSFVAMDCLLTAKPEQARHVDRNGNTLLHRVIKSYHVFGKELAEKVWRMNPAAVRVANLQGWTPLHSAIAGWGRDAHCKPLVELFQWEFSLDEIVNACAWVGSPVGIVRPAVDLQFEALLAVLGRDLTNIVHQYFWIEPPKAWFERRKLTMHLP